MLVPMICPKKPVRGKNTPSNISWQELKDPLHKKKKRRRKKRNCCLALNEAPNLVSAALLFLMLRGAHLLSSVLRSVSHCSLHPCQQKEGHSAAEACHPHVASNCPSASWLERLGVASARGGVIGEALSALLGCGAGRGPMPPAVPTSRTTPTGKKSKAPQCHFDEWFRITKLSS